MSIVQVLGESAVRSLALAFAVAVLMRVLGVRHARLAKRAWTAVLVLSLAMPALVALRIPSFSFTALWTAPRVVVAPPSPSNTYRTFDTVTDTHATPAPAQMAPPAPVVQFQLPVPAALQGAPDARRRLAWWQIGFAAYLTITAVLLLRLLLGLALAARLWRRAQSFTTAHTDLSVRLSVDLRSPATVGRGILLPLEAIEWDDAILRTTLAHEAQHIREGDFYLQFAATLHHCFFWISPHAWWLRPQLSSLSETICDRAALASAGDGLSYAQLLLRLATAEQTPAGMLAMAHSAGLRERVDRLIADPELAGAFRKRRGQGVLAAALLAAVALVAAVSIHLVQPAAIVLAAPQSPAPPAAPSDASAPQVAPQAAPHIIAPAPAATPLHAAPPISPVTQPRSETDLPPGQGFLLRALPATRMQNHVLMMTPSLHMTPVPLPSIALARPLVIPNMRAMKVMVFDADDSNLSLCVPSHPDATATCELNGSTVTVGPGSHPGGAILFERDGKTYIIDDPALVKQAQQAYERVEELGKQQGDLGAKQGKLGAQQGDLGVLEGQIGALQGELNGIQFGFAPYNFKFEMPKDFDNSVQIFADDTVKLALDEKLSEQERAQLEAQQKQAQANFDKAMAAWKAQEPQRQAMEKQMRDQAEQMRKQMEPLIEKMRELGAKQGELGRLQGELGRQQALLGVQQREAGRAANRKVQSLIDQAVKDGKAHPVQ